MLYYGASMLHGQLSRGESYSKLCPVYVLCFMDFKLQHISDQLLYHYTLMEVNTAERYGNQLSIFLFELKRLKKKELKGLNPLESWLFILKNMGTFAGKPEDMGTRYSAVAKAAKMHDLPDTDKLRYLKDMITEEEILDMREATLEEGREEGRAQGIRMIKEALTLLKQGVSVQEISEKTGLSVEDIEDLR